MNTLDLDHLEKPIERAIADFQNQLDVNQLLIDIRTALIRFAEELVVSVIKQLLSDPHFLATLKVRAGKSALRFNPIFTT